MVARHVERLERLDRLASVIPWQERADQSAYPDAGQLLQKLSENYPQTATKQACLRRIQRDLEELAKAGRIRVVNPKGKPARFQRTDGDGGDRVGLEHALNALGAQLESAPDRLNLDHAFRQFLADCQSLAMGEGRIASIPAELRLAPPAFSGAHLLAAARATVLRRCISMQYINAQGKRSACRLHPQALVQRGPAFYLYATREDAPNKIRLYALQRFTHLEVEQETAKGAPEFDIELALRSGSADFTSSGVVRLVLLARGYVSDLLQECRISADQHFEMEAARPDYEIRVVATVRDSGSLLRWLLGCGSNIEVLEPADIRERIASQAQDMAHIYGDDH